MTLRSEIAGNINHSVQPSIDLSEYTDEQLATILEGYKRAAALNVVDGEVVTSATRRQ